MPTLKLTYFDLPSRSEITWLAFAIGGIAFDDCRIPCNQWPVLKPATPYNQLSILTVDGHVFSQSHAIARYAGALSDLYPTSNPVAALLVDKVDNFNEEILTLLIPAPSNPIQRRSGRYAKLDSSHFDCGLGHLQHCRSAQEWWLPDIPKDMSDVYPIIPSIYRAVHSHHKVVAWYASQH
ncbi:hypothetical protein DYB37_004862 [Aphanomyces astaci]|uniref:GST N-terminal domain-containing protein n=2 Tax=Aphanomyces astaci TaxID=112090 RepID=A0A3R6WDY0_APHAT|nr:hypothetical protein DYB35_005407 [Aphanomyces astaci]RHZ20812.1 hypothetical protein DYB37_004862 [Aphanomyces astaci]